jgi:hypothetical protein
MIFIGIDVSKISTALCIENNNITSLYSYTTKKDNNIWVKDTNNYINYRYINYKYISEKDYSKSQISKLNEFDETTNLIIDDIFKNINSPNELKIAIEGYSYNSKGPIFDLIEFTTILKHKLMNKIITHTNINIISPMTLKTECCKMVYKPRIEFKGKKIIKKILHYENTKGKQATKFDKWDMYYAYLDSNINMDLKEWCKKYNDNITKGKEVPKPLDDIIDAIFLKEMVKNI